MSRRRRRFGASMEVHTQSAQDEAREIKRLASSLRRHLKSPPDCATAARLALLLAETGGIYLRDISGSKYKIRGKGFGRGSGALLNKFISACVVKPRSASAARKMRAIWR